MKRGKNKTTGTDFLRYRRGEMKGTGRNAFERGLQGDPFASEAAEGYETISAADAGSDLRELSRKLMAGKKRNRIAFYRIAASVAVLMIVSSIFLFIERKNMKETTGDLMPVQLEIAAAEPVKANAAEEDISSVIEKPATETSVQRRIEPGKAAAAVAVPENDEMPAKKEQEENEAVIIEAEEVADAVQVPAVAAKRMISENIVPVGEARGGATLYPPIRGKVVSAEDGEPVPGASVMIKGTSQGAVTGIDGSFSINTNNYYNIYNNKYNNTNNNITLVASFIGMNTKEVNAVPGKPVEFVLSPSEMALSEVVVVGYGVSNRDANEPQPEEYTPPQPEDGRTAFNKYIGENIRRPDTATAGQRVVVVAGFRVRKDGTPDSIRIIRSPDERFSSEAIRLIRSGPRWKPATRNGEIIEDEVRLRIVFR